MFTVKVDLSELEQCEHWTDYQTVLTAAFDAVLEEELVKAGVPKVVMDGMEFALHSTTLSAFKVMVDLAGMGYSLERDEPSEDGTYLVEFHPGDPSEPPLTGMGYCMLSAMTNAWTKAQEAGGDTQLVA